MAITTSIAHSDQPAIALRKTPSETFGLDLIIRPNDCNSEFAFKWPCSVYFTKIDEQHGAPASACRIDAGETVRTAQAWVKVAAHRASVGEWAEERGHGFYRLSFQIANHQLLISIPIWIAVDKQPAAVTEISRMAIFSQQLWRDRDRPRAVEMMQVKASLARNGVVDQ